MALIIWTSTFKLVKSIWGFFLHTLSTSYIKELFNIFNHFIINSLVFHFKQFNSECTEILHTPNAFVYRAFFSRLSCVTTHFKSLRTLKKKNSRQRTLEKNISFCQSALIWSILTHLKKTKMRWFFQGALPQSSFFRQHKYTNLFLVTKNDVRCNLNLINVIKTS